MKHIPNLFRALFGSREPKDTMLLRRADYTPLRQIYYTAIAWRVTGFLR